MFTPETYRAFLKEHDHLKTEENWLYRGRKHPPASLTEKIYVEMPLFYLSQLPTFVLARCPICGGLVREAIDTFSLAGIGWCLFEPLGFGWFGQTSARPYRSPMVYAQPRYQAECACIQAVMYGVNLHAILPTDVRAEPIISSERPNVLRPFMVQEGSYAVIHTLPIGRLDETTGQARYTAYFVSYFSQNPNAYRDSLAPQDPLTTDFVWPYWQLDYDLQPWFDAGKLFWLDQNLSLQNQGLYPYAQLDGLRGRWQIRYGRLRLIPEKLSYAEWHNANNRAWDKAEQEASVALAQYPHHPLSF